MANSKTIRFIGRQQELEDLERLENIRTASMVVIKGRRRIGKSRLIEEFGKNKQFYAFSGLAPREGIDAQAQRSEFAKQLEIQFNIPGLRATDWSDLFIILAKLTENDNRIILFDEISWMAIGDPDFLGKLKIAWDLYFKKNPQLILILCGSVSAWIEKNILSSSGFLGRPSLHIDLDELPLKECNHFWNNYGSQISAYEKLKLLSVTGGVPRYLELINPQQTAEENIRSLCFTPSGPLFDEFNYIFADIYGNRSNSYQAIVSSLADGSLTQEIISEKTKIPQGGDLSEYLDDLVEGGFIQRDYTWSIKTGKVSKLSKYRLKDNYTRFYIKYILPNKILIEKGKFLDRLLSTLPGFKTMLGLQFENLIINNSKTILKQLSIRAEDIVFENPFFQRKTSRNPGCQIDFMIQTQHDCIYLCEIKFSNAEIKLDIINEVKEKINRIKVPKHFSIRPVLIHVNGVHEDVIDSMFFSDIIDFGELILNSSE